MSNRTFVQGVRIASWVGDALLMLLAVWLAIHNRDTLTVQTALALGLCVVLGGTLPIAVYFIDYLHAQNARQAAEARSPESLRAALSHLDKLVRQVEDTAVGSAKATLVARQIPDRIEEKMAALSAIADRLKPESVAALTTGLEQLGKRLEDHSTGTPGSSPEPDPESVADREILRALGAQLPALTAAIATNPCAESVSRVEAAIADLRREWAELRQSVETDNLMRDEKLDTLLERLEDPELIEEEWAEDPLEEELTVAQLPDPPAPEPEDAAQISSEDDAEEILDDDWEEEPAAASDAFLPPDAETVPEDADAPAEASASDDEGPTDDPSEEAISESEPSAQGEANNASAKEAIGEPVDAPETKVKEDEAPARKAARARPALPRKAAKTAAADEMHLFSADEIQSAPLTEKIAPNRGLLLVKAFVGISNQLFARGDAPLNWEEGVALRASGIGEWRLELEDLPEPTQIELRINDEIAALGPPIKLLPGEPRSVSPRFP